MAEMKELLAGRAALDAEIQAQKPLAVAKVTALMAELGLTWDDLGVVPLGKAPPAAKRAVKYRDEQGNTWTGVGQRPRWLAARLRAGATIEQFRVKV